MTHFNMSTTISSSYNANTLFPLIKINIWKSGPEKIDGFDLPHKNHGCVVDLVQYPYRDSLSDLRRTNEYEPAFVVKKIWLKVSRLTPTRTAFFLTDSQNQKNGPSNILQLPFFRYRFQQNGRFRARTHRNETLVRKKRGGQKSFRSIQKVLLTY